MGDKVQVVSLKEFKERALAKENVQGLAVSKQFVLDEVKQVDGEDLVLQFTISTGTVDRDNDTVNPDGWKLDNYLRNPVVLFAHDYQALPVARAEAIWVEGGSLKSKARFTSHDLYPFGYMVYQFYQQGFMRATSVGFAPSKWQFSDDRKYGVDFQEQELLEYSCVPVPANPEALVDAKAKGIDTSPLKEWAERVLDDWHEEKGLWLPRSQVEAVFAAVSGKKSITVPGMTTKGTISYASAHPDGTPKAPEDEAWDGPAEVAAADVDDLKVMAAWMDSENAENKGAYKLLHHKAAGQHAVVWAGVRAAMGALLGARGGVAIPDDDRRGVYNHLARHYREFDKEPPEFRSVDEIIMAYAEGQHQEGPGEVKTGRVLSKANEERIRQAAALLQEVLDQLEVEEPEPEQDSPDSVSHKDGGPAYLTLADTEPGNEPQTNLDIDPEMLKEMVRAAVSESIRAISGKVD